MPLLHIAATYAINLIEPVEIKMKVLNYNTKEVLAVLSDDRKKALKELTRLSNSKNYLVHSVRNSFALVFVK